MHSASDIYISRINIFPVKSLDGISVKRSQITKGGALQYDRMFALKDEEGNLINAKKYPRIQTVRNSFNLDSMEMSIQFDKHNLSMNLESDAHIIADWFSEFLEIKATLHRDDKIGFPDDVKRTGPTICSTASISGVNKWFPNLNEEEIRRRFRTNIEISGPDIPFWEDGLLYTDEEPGQFNISGIEFLAIKPCPRCPVPSRDSQTAEPLSGFQKTFTEKRASSIATGIDSKLFPHHYMFAMNTRITSGFNKQIEVGDRLMGTRVIS